MQGHNWGSTRIDNVILYWIKLQTPNTPAFSLKKKSTLLYLEYLGEFTTMNTKKYWKKESVKYICVDEKLTTHEMEQNKLDLFFHSHYSSIERSWIELNIIHKWIFNCNLTSFQKTWNSKSCQDEAIMKFSDEKKNDDQLLSVVDGSDTIAAYKTIARGKQFTCNTLITWSKSSKQASKYIKA